MDQKYSGLHALIGADTAAKQYFDKLPEYVRDMMHERPDGINSFESLRHYAENLTKGDG